MSTKTSFKRVALVAVAALGMGVLTSVSPANAAIAATTSPVRVSFTGTVLDSVPYAALSWTAGNIVNTADTATLVVNTAPSAAAKMKIVAATSIGADNGGAIGSVGAGIDTLGGTATSIAVGNSADVAVGGTASIGFTVDTIGTYVGTITIQKAGVVKDELTFSFTTTGAVSSYTVTASASTVSPSGSSTLTVSTFDSANKPTQPNSLDSFALTTTAGSLGSASVTSTEIYDGTADDSLTTSSTASASHTVTVTPQGTLGTLAAKTVTITNDSTVIYATTDADIAFTVTAPADAAAATGTVDGGDRAQSVRTGTSAMTVGVTSATASSTLRFKITASSGTVDGTAYTTPVYKNVATDASGVAAVSFTLGGGALLTGSTVTVAQVTVANAAIAPTTTSTTDIVITQADAATSTSRTVASPAGSIVRKLATSTSVTVTVKDQFAAGLGAGWTVRAYRGTVAAGNLVASGVTGSTGAATLTVTPLSTVVADGTETYVYTYQGVGGSESSAISNTTAVTYTTTGEITSLSTAITGTTGATTPVTDTTLATAVTILPAIIVPADGSASDVSGDQVYTKSTGAVTGTANATAEVITLASNATADNTATYTASAGAFVSSTATTAWNAGLSTYEAAEGASVYVFATKTGLHTITITSGGKTTSVQFWAYNLATNYYSISAAPESAKPTAGSNTVVTLTIKDIFGNVVDAADGLVTVTASGRVRLAGQALSQSLNTAANGTAQFTVIADGNGGAGTLSFAPTSTGAEAWLTGYTAPTGAAAPVSTASLSLTVTGGSSDLVTLVNSLIKKINAMQLLLNKIQKRLGVK